MTAKESLEVMKNLPKSTLAKWVLFLAFVYALYDGVYLWADSKRLMLDLSDVTDGLVPILILHIDLPLFVGSVLLCLIFDRRRMFAALAVRSGRDMIWMVLGALCFVAVVFLQEPSGSVAAYGIVQALVIRGILEELIFRGLFFSWMDAAGCGWLAYLVSGLVWGAHYGISRIVTTSTMTLWAVLPMAIFGAVVGTLAAIIYKKSGSLWLVAYLHGALSLL